MCKVMAIAGITNKTRKNAWAFAIAASKHLSVNDNDGFGYAGMTADGELFGERWLTNAHAFKRRDAVSTLVESIERNFLGALSTDRCQYNSFGNGAVDSANVSAMILHARMATCDVSLANVHPFVKDGTALIHNGIISNAAALNSNTLSTCDSEVILHSYLKNMVRGDALNIQNVADDLRGYYAVAVLTRTKSGTPVLDIWRDDKAKLVAVWVPKLNALVYCTEADIVRRTCKALKWKCGQVFKIQDDVMLRVAAETGHALEVNDFESSGYATHKWVHGGEVIESQSEGSISYKELCEIEDRETARRAASSGRSGELLTQDDIDRLNRRLSPGQPVSEAYLDPFHVGEGS